jgi:hypothetical protein
MHTLVRQVRDLPNDAAHREHVERGILGVTYFCQSLLIKQIQTWRGKYPIALLKNRRATVPRPPTHRMRICGGNFHGGR